MLLQWLFPSPKLRPADALLGGVSATVAIAVTWWVSEKVLDGVSPILALSMGASALLIFMTPRGPMAQPGPVIIAHVVGAIVGVSSAKVIENVPLAAGVAVGLTAMIITVLGCTHPPSGGTAVSAVVGGVAVTDLGYEYVMRPVLLNAALLVLLAIVLNAPFAARRYPLRVVKN